MVVLLVLPQAVEPALITVSGGCNVNDAVAAANSDAPVGGCPAGSGADTIRLTADVVLTVALPDVTSEIKIEGDHLLGRSFFDANKFRILNVTAAGDLSLDAVTIAGGNTDSGGGGIRNLGKLSLSNTTVTGNFATVDGSVVRGGGIYNQGVTRIADSTVSFNYAKDTGAGTKAYGAGIFNDTYGSLVVSNTTLSSNEAVAGLASYGGGLFSANTASDSVTISNSTVSGNAIRSTDPGSYVFGGGIYARDLHLTNSTVSGNQAQGHDAFAGGVRFTSGALKQVTFFGNEVTSPSAGLQIAAAVLPTYASTESVSGSLFATSVGADHCGGLFIDAGGNLSDNSGTCMSIPQTLSGLDPVLTDNGGPTMTHKLTSPSTAFDIAGACGLPDDQRGAGRITSCDSGAFEYIGCDLLELDFQIITTDVVETTCNTALLGPNLVVDAPGSLDVTADWQVVIKNGFVLDSGAELTLGN